MSRMAAIIVVVLALSASLGRGQWIEDSIWVPGACQDIAYNPVSNKVYVALTTDQVAIIDGSTNQVINTVSAPEYPNQLAVNTVSNKVYCISGDADVLTIICGAGDTLIKTLNLPGFPHQMAFNPTMNRLYVASFDLGLVRIIDGARDSLLKSVRLGSSGPGYLLWHPNTNRLFCSVGSVDVLDCVSEEVVHSNSMQGAGVMCHNRVNDFVYVLTGDTVYGLAAAGDSIVAKIPLHIGYYGAAACAVPYPNKVYAEAYRIQVIDCNTNALITTLSGREGELVCDTIAGKVYGTTPGQGVRVFDAHSDTMVGGFDGDPVALAWNWRNRRMYAADWRGFVYSIEDTASAVEEGATPNAEYWTCHPTVVRGVLMGSWPMAGGVRQELLDAAGRGVMELRPGPNDVRHLNAGVYFIRKDGERARKVIIGR